MSAIVEQVADDFGRVQHLDHARPMIEQRAVHGRAVAERDELPAARSSASGVGMKSQICTRASGPTSYQPFSAPSALMYGNFM